MNPSPAHSSIFAERMVPSGRIQLWMGTSQLTAPPRAEVLLTHGLGEHASRYEHVAARLGEAGIRVHAYDLRGHGRSGGRRGDAPRYEALLDDLETIRRQVAAVCSPGAPLFYMGHSLGGQITLSYLLARQPADCAGAVIASPWLKLAFYPQRWRLILARVARLLCPWWLQRRPALREVLSRDLSHLNSLAGPELIHQHISARLYFQIEAAGERLLARAGEWRAPLLLMHGGDDRVTSAAASEAFFQATPALDKTWRLWPESRHETHNDLDRARVLDCVAEWILQRASTGVPTRLAPGSSAR